MSTKKMTVDATLVDAVELLVESYERAQRADDDFYAGSGRAVNSAREASQRAWDAYAAKLELAADLFGLPSAAVQQIVDAQSAERIYPGLAFGKLPPQDADMPY